MIRPTLAAWHEVVQLRDDLKTGELSLNMFAADLHDVVMGKARRVYQDPYEFFALTYPTYNLRELVKDVVLRLAGKNDKAIRQLELTYGGGKTHTLITLYHLTHTPRSLPKLPAVQEFIQHIAQLPPQARIAVLAFDKLDVESGMEVIGPNGEQRRLLYPWSVLAFQLAGSEGLRVLNAEGKDEERETAPAEPLLVELLSIPVRQGLAPLILIDEVLMYMHGKVMQNANWRWTLLNFFQALTQAVTKVDTSAIVASLLATDPNKSDTLGKELTQQVQAIFRREREEAVEPVSKEDVAEVLRRRFFTPKSLENPARFRQFVSPIVQGIAELSDELQRDRQRMEERVLKSYPFHPDLTEVLFSKWTQLESFQRTRGVLRTFALALRDAEKWDHSPLISTNVFLSEPGRADLADAARELTNVAESEEYEGQRQNWSAILEGELDKAREIQREEPGLRYREIEQAVFATFLHSQPIRNKARAKTSELLVLLGAGHPDRIVLEKGLRRWTEVSWFLDESAFQDAQTGDIIYKGLPGSWRLGSRPNLRQMHHDASSRVASSIVEEQLKLQIGACKSLTAGASPTGAHVHMLPEHPRDIADDGDFHYAVLGPEVAARPGDPRELAKRYIVEKTGPDSPRVYRNAVVLAVPLDEALEAVRTAIKDHQGWIDVEIQLKGQELEGTRQQLLETEKKNARLRIVELVKQAYCIVVALSAKNEIEAFKVVVGDGSSLFNVIKADTQARIQETAVTAEALLPDGPYDLWREGDTEHRVSYLEKAFAQFAHLPKMLKVGAILDTLLDGCRHGTFVLRDDRSDRSQRTYWYEAPDAATARTLNLSIVLSEAAHLTDIPSRLLIPGTLPTLWSGLTLTLRDLYTYFAGRTVTVARENYSEPFIIPKASRDVVNEAIRIAVKAQQLWLLSGRASLLGEDIPPDLLTDDATLQSQPQPLPARDLLPDNLTSAWRGRSEVTALDIADALSTKVGVALPWPTVRQAIDSAITSRYIVLAPESGRWPCDYIHAQSAKFRDRNAPMQPTQPVQSPHMPELSSSSPIITDRSDDSGGYSTPPVSSKPDTIIAASTLSPAELQNLEEQMTDIMKLCAANDLRPTFHMRIEITGAKALPDEKREALNALLQEISKRLRLS